MPSTHVAIVDAEAAEHLLAGTKRIETRFSQHRRPPFGQVRIGDTIHFKLSGGHIIGTSRVQRVRHLDRLTPADVLQLRQLHNAAVRAPARYWWARRRCRFGVLIWIGRLSRPPAGVRVPRQYGNGWLILDRP